MKENGFYYQSLKTVKRSLIKLTEKQKKLWNLNFTTQEEHLILIHLSPLKDLGSLEFEI